MTSGLAAAQIQERYESKDQMEESWAFNTMFLFHTCFYSLGRKDILTKPLSILSFCCIIYWSKSTSSKVQWRFYGMNISKIEHVHEVLRCTKKKWKNMLVTPPLQGIPELYSGPASDVEMSRNAGEGEVITGGVLTPVLSTLLSLCPWSGVCHHWHVTRDTWHVTSAGTKKVTSVSVIRSIRVASNHHLHLHAESHKGFTET